MKIYKEEFNDVESIEVIERPNDPEQFEEDLRNSEEGELLGRDAELNRWAIYKEKGKRAGVKCQVLKICIYPSALER